MPKKRVNLSIDSNLVDRWDKVVKQIGWNKSAMVQDFVSYLLSYIEEEKKRNKTFKKIFCD